MEKTTACPWCARPATVHVVIARCMHVQPHIAVRGVDEHVVGPAGNLQMAVGFQFGGCPVVDHFVGTDHVIAVMAHHIAGKGQRIANPVLLFGLPLDGSPGSGLRLRHGQGHQFLAGVVGERVRCGISGVWPASTAGCAECAALVNSWGTCAPKCRWQTTSIVIHTKLRGRIPRPV